MSDVHIFNNIKKEMLLLQYVWQISTLKHQTRYKPNWINLIFLYFLYWHWMNWYLVRSQFILKISCIDVFPLFAFITTRTGACFNKTVFIQEDGIDLHNMVIFWSFLNDFFFSEFLIGLIFFHLKLEEKELSTTGLNLYECWFNSKCS